MNPRPRFWMPYLTSITTRIILVTIAVAAITLDSSLIYSHFATRSMAEAFVAEHVNDLAESYFDALNKAMLTGHMDQREDLRKSLLSQANVVEARVIRGEPVIALFGPGYPDEHAADDVDRQALMGSAARNLGEQNGHRIMTVLQPFKASRNTRGVDCLQCHTNAKEGTVLGAIRLTYDLDATDRHIIQNEVVSFLLHTALFALCVGAFIIWLRRAVSKPLGALSETMQRAREESDLSVRVATRDGSDEVARSGVAFNDMMQRFAAILLQVDGATKRLAGLSEKMVAVTSETQHGAEQQLADTEELATTLRQMASTIDGVAALTRQAAEAATQADGEARHGALISTEVSESIDVMSKKLDDAAEIIRLLDNESRDIGRVIGLIREIADQTNLLALNAAIEAARAGEQGRGFAVVADEVRKLAHRTQEATAEIGKMISNIQGSAEKAAGAIVDAEETTKRGVATVQRTVEALKAISDSVARITEMNSRISQGAAEESQAAAEISVNVGEISKIAQQTSMGAGETQAVSAELVSLSRELKSLMEQFKVQQ